MRVLQVHNRYKTSPGGEDVVVAMENQQLLDHGHIVKQHIVTNTYVDSESIGKVVLSGVQSIWSIPAYRELLSVIEEFKPDIVHVHNTFARLSPSIFWAIRQSRIPSVLTLHNYRITCATATLFRDGHLCEECVGRVPVAAFRHRCCYNGSFPAGASIAISQFIHHLLKTYSKAVDAIIVLGEPSKAIMARAGVPDDRMHVKPNFVIDAATQYLTSGSRSKQMVFVGQIAAEKGVDLLLGAWSKLDNTGEHLILIGDGPDKASLQERFSDRTDIVWLGRQDRMEVFKRIAQSEFLVMPSLWYEPFGLVVAEALMLSTPVIVPDHVSFAANVVSGQGGLSFTRNDTQSLTQVLAMARTVNKETWRELSQNARHLYVQWYSPDKNYALLTAIYDLAINQFHR